MAGADRGRGIAAFAQEELHLELTPAQAEMLSTFVAGDFSRAVWRCGRRGGKSLLADVLALYDVALRDHLRDRVRPGEARVAAIVAPRIEQARAHIRNCSALVARSPLLSRLRLGETADELEFANGAAIRAYPCSARTIRGDAWSCCVLDELAHFLDTSDGPAAGDRVLEATVPALAQFGSDGWLVAISTPRWRQGAFFRLVERATSGRFEHTHYRHLGTSEMNPRISKAWLEEQRREDPELYAREFAAQFIDGAGSYLDSAEVVAAVRNGVTTLPPRTRRYVMAADPAYARDAFGLAVGHREDDGRTIIDGVWAWTRHGHEATIAAVADVAKAYGCRSVRIDQHAAQPVREALARHGLVADYQPWTAQSKADAFSSLRIALNTRAIELPDDRDLVEELVGLEARPTPAGFLRIAAAGSGHDDRAVCVASVAHMLREGARLSAAEVQALSDLQTSLRRRSRYDTLPSPGSLRQMSGW